MRGAHLPRIREDGRVDLVAVADTAQEQAQTLLEAWGGEAAYSADFRRMVRQQDLDAVFISSSDAAFFRWIRGGKSYEEPVFALQVARLSEAAYRSVEEGGPVRVRR